MLGFHPGDLGSTPSRITNGRVAQLAEASGLGPEGCKFDSCHGHQWRVPVKGCQQGLNPWAGASSGVRFVYSPPMEDTARRSLLPIANRAVPTGIGVRLLYLPPCPHSSTGRARSFYLRCWPFESVWGCHARIAQMEEHFPTEEGVEGSSPSASAINALVAQRKSSCMVSSRSWVRFPPEAPLILDIF
jgi:hypothetical protein